MSAVRGLTASRLHSRYTQARDIRRLLVLEGHGHICLIAPNVNLGRILEEWRAG